MQTHDTRYVCRRCGVPLAMTTERDWTPGLITGILCCPACRTRTGLQDRAVLVEEIAESEEGAVETVVRRLRDRRSELYQHGI